MSKSKTIEKFATIIIITSNVLEATRKCYESIRNTDYKNLEIIFVDNCSLDGTVDYLEELQKRDKRITVIRNTVNAGCFKARNQALGVAVGDYLVFLDNDAYVCGRNWLRKMISELESDNRLGLVCPKIIYPDSEKVFAAGGGVTQEGNPFLWCQGVPKKSSLVNFSREIQYAPATCWALKRSVFERIGYFEESYILITFGDVDYCYKLRHNGFKIKYYPNVEILHAAGSTWKYLKIDYYKFTEINRALFKKRWEFMYSKEPYRFLPPPNEIFKRKKLSFVNRGRPKRKVSVVIVTKNNLFELRKTLEGLFQYMPDLHELIIIDLGSTDLTPVYLANLPIKNIKIIMDKSIGTFTKARVIAGRIASSKKKVFIKPGEVIDPNWLQKI